MRDSGPEAIDSAIAELLRRREQRRAVADVEASDRARRHREAADAYDRVIDVLRSVRGRDARSNPGGSDAEVLFQYETTDGTEHRRLIERTTMPDTPYVLTEQTRPPGASEWRHVGAEPIADYHLDGQPRPLVGVWCGP